MFEIYINQNISLLILLFSLNRHTVLFLIKVFKLVFGHLVIATFYAYSGGEAFSLMIIPCRYL